MRHRRLLNKKNVAKCCIVLSLLCAAFCCLSLPCYAADYSANVGSNGHWVKFWQPQNESDWTGRITDTYFPDNNTSQNWIVLSPAVSTGYGGTVITYLNTTKKVPSPSPFLYSYTGVGGWQWHYRFYFPGYVGPLSPLVEPLRSGRYNLFFVEKPYITGIKFRINVDLLSDYIGPEWDLSFNRLWLDASCDVADRTAELGYKTLTFEFPIEYDKENKVIFCETSFMSPLRLNTLGINFVGNVQMVTPTTELLEITGINSSTVLSCNVRFLFNDGISFILSTKSTWQVYDDSLTSLGAPSGDSFIDYFESLDNGFFALMNPIKQMSFSSPLFSGIFMIVGFFALVSAIYGISLAIRRKF